MMMVGMRPVVLQRVLLRAAHRVWRVPLVIASCAFAACGPLHALGLEAVVRPVAEVALLLAVAAVPLGLSGSRPPAGEEEG